MLEILIKEGQPGFGISERVQKILRDQDIDDNGAPDNAMRRRYREARRPLDPLYGDANRLVGCRVRGLDL